MAVSIAGNLGLEGDSIGFRESASTNKTTLQHDNAHGSTITLTLPRIDSRTLVAANNGGVATRIVDLDVSGVTGTRIWTFPDAADTFVGLNTAQTLDSKTLTNATLDLPKINDDSVVPNTYDFAVSTLAANRTITLPLLTGNDEFVFKDHAVTLTNKVLGASNTVDNSSGFTLDASTANQNVDLFPSIGTGTVFIGSATSTTHIRGDIFVAGDSATLEVSTLEVEDAEIRVNKNGTNGTAAGAGIEVEGTGASTLATIQYDSALASDWKLGPSGSEAEVVTTTHTQTISAKTLASNDVTGNLEYLNEAEVRFYDSGSAKYLGFKAPATVAAGSSFVWVLPDDDGAASQVLSTNGSGTLQWASALTSALANDSIFVGDGGGSSTATDTAGQGDVLADHSTGLTLKATALSGTTYTGTKDFTGTLNNDGAAVFNESGADVDFRVEGDTDANLLFVDASTDSVGIGTSGPEAKVHIFGSNSSVTPDAAANDLFIESSGDTGLTIGSGTTSNGIIAFGDSGDANIGIIDYDHNDNSLSFTVNAAERAVIDSSGLVGLGSTAPSTDGVATSNNLVVKGSGNTGITVLCGSTNFSDIQFTGTAGTTQGAIRYDANADVMRVTTNNSEAIRIDDNQLVGIGSTSPSTDGVSTDNNLVVKGSSNTGITVLCGASNFAGLQFTGTAGTQKGSIRYDANGDVMRIGTNNSEAIRIDSTQRVGIGETSPGATLHVSADSSAGAAIFEQESTTTDEEVVNINTAAAESAGTKLVRFSAASSACGGIEVASANNVQFFSESDARLKENIVELGSQIENIKRLQPVAFNYLGRDETSIGFIAQQIGEVYPDVVNTTKISSPHYEKAGLDMNEKYFTVSGWSSREARLVKAMQEMIERIEILERKH